VRILSRYILREFISYLGYSLLSFAAVFILVDLVDKMDTFIDSRAGIKVILYFYLFYLPYIMTMVIPVAMLLATMFSLGRLVGDNEVTAMKASGISLYRILFPLYVFSLFVGLGVMLFSEMVVPKTNLQYQQIWEFVKTRKNEIRDAGGNITPKTTFSFSIFSNRERDRDNVFMMNGDGRMIYSRYYHARTKTAEGVFIITPSLDKATGGDPAVSPLARLTSRIDADSMVYANGAWELRNATERTFLSEGVRLVHYPSLPAAFINRKPADLAEIDLKPESMNFLQLRNYIRGIRDKGGDASEWLVDMYMKISFPFVSFVIVFFGAPMVAGSMGRGKAASFGIALMISFIFYAFINGFQVLGRTGTVNPLLAAWISNAFFFFIGIVQHMRASK
jgi:lipopolysaccharide export system permease protein